MNSCKMSVLAIFSMHESLDETWAQNIPLKDFFNLCNFLCLLFATILNNFQQNADYFLQ